MPSSPRPGALRSLLSLYATRDYWMISTATFFRYGTLGAIQGLWIGPYMIRWLGFSPMMVETSSFCSMGG